MTELLARAISHIPWRWPRRFLLSLLPPKVVRLSREDLEATRGYEDPHEDWGEP